MNEDIVEALAIIGNTKKVVERCEPNIFCPQELKAWMVKRTLRALELFEDEFSRLDSR